MTYEEMATCIGRWPAGFVKATARQFVEQRKESWRDREDLEQDLVLHILEKKPRFDASKSTWNSYVKLIVQQKIANLFRQLTTQKRNSGIPLISFGDLKLGSL